MNPVEIEEAVSELASEPFDAEEFPFQFLAAFGNKKTTLNRLRKGSSNHSDFDGGVLQRNNIHIAPCDPGAVDATLKALRDDPKTEQHKAKFILATDGETLQAEDLASGEPIVCDYADFPNHFGFFLPLAGITTVKQVRENTIDIRATGRLNKLYVELLRANPDWAERRPDMNHFMARLIFCFFAEDTGIFHASHGFTPTVEKMSARDASDMHQVIGTLFHAMNVRTRDDDGKLTNRFREDADIPNWANNLPYVNGELFSGTIDVPRFSKIARSYLLHVGNLDWTKINPDIFGSMIQAVADDEERGALGMHYTSVPNILKVLNPLFLDDLRAKLEEAGDNSRKLLNLRNRMAKIRVFDPACGSGNFLVIAYKEMRAIEAEINERRGESDRKTDIPLTNFRGIELRDFPAEIARLALIIAEYQCDVLYRGQKEALAEFLPLDTKNWIKCGNALRLDWLELMDVHSTGVKARSNDLFETLLDQPEIDFENASGETFICGNPPYLGSKWQSGIQKNDLESVFAGTSANWKSLDYVAGWFFLAARFSLATDATAAFVATNSICQGQQVPILWKEIFRLKQKICFAHTSFKWANLASNNAGVIVAVIGISSSREGATLYSTDPEGHTNKKEVENISPYLVDAPTVFVEKRAVPLDDRGKMLFGNMPRDGGNLLLSQEERNEIIAQFPAARSYIRKFCGSEDMIRGNIRYCIWTDRFADEARMIAPIASRFAMVAEERKKSRAASTRSFSQRPHRFVQIQGVAARHSFIIPRVSSERRRYLPIDLVSADTIVADSAFAIYDAPLWNFALIASRLHLVWIGAVCGKLKTDFRYSNTIGWNTFPLPQLTAQNRSDLEESAKAILLARQRLYPATIAELYNPDEMPKDLIAAHEANDEIVERAYAGRRFRNDSERLAELFKIYRPS